MKEFRAALQQTLWEYQLKKIGPRIIAAGLVGLTAYYLAKQPIPDKTAGETPAVAKTVLVQPEKPETETIYAEPAYGKAPTISFEDLCRLSGLKIHSQFSFLSAKIKFPDTCFGCNLYNISDLSEIPSYESNTYRLGRDEGNDLFSIVVLRSIQHPEGISYGFFLKFFFLAFPIDGDAVISSPSSIKFLPWLNMPPSLFESFPLIITDSQRRSNIDSDASLDKIWPLDNYFETHPEIPVRIDHWSIAPSERVSLTSGPEKFKEGKLTAIVLITSDGYPDLQKNINSLPLGKRIEFELSGSKLNLFSRAWALVQVSKKQDGSSQIEESEFVFSPLRYTLFDLPPGPSIVNYCPLLVIKDRKVNSILEKLGYKLLSDN